MRDVIIISHPVASELIRWSGCLGPGGLGEVQYIAFDQMSPASSEAKMA